MLFDSSDEENEEVSLRTPEDSDSSDDDSTDLHNEVEARLGTDTGSSTSTSTGTGTSVNSGSSGSVSLKDIKEQNEEIISLLRDIKNEGRSSGTETEDNDSSTRGDPSELL